MTELFCTRCNSKLFDRLFRGKIIYVCKSCRNDFTASQVKDFLLDKLRQETGYLKQLDVCPTCGRKLSAPNWCSWCGKEPISADEIKNLSEQIKAIEGIIESDDSEGRKLNSEYQAKRQAEDQAENQRARDGDLEAQSGIFLWAKTSHKNDRGYGESSSWKRLIDLGASVVPFLINQLNDDQWETRAAAISALIDIGDDRAVEPLMKGLGHPYPYDYTHPGGNSVILAELKTKWSAITPKYVGQLLNRIDEILAIIQTKNKNLYYSDLHRALVNDIYKLLEFILDHAAIEVSDIDLLAVSAMKDISMEKPVVDNSVGLTRYEDDAGFYEGPAYRLTTNTIDCSLLREAAQNEMKRRTLN